jgi:anti-anti-sigma regulatory factor
VNPSPDSLFEITRDGDLLVVTPTTDLSETLFELHHAGAAAVLVAYRDGPARHVVWDLRHTGVFGSTALAFFVKVWRRVAERGGRMAFCNLTAYEREILRVTKMDQLWPLCPDRAGAVAAVRG